MENVTMVIIFVLVRLYSGALCTHRISTSKNGLSAGLHGVMILM